MLLTLLQNPHVLTTLTRPRNPLGLPRQTTSERPKVVRTCAVFDTSSLIYPHGSAPAALASLLFNPPEQQNIGKSTVFRDFSTFSCTCIFFLLTLSLLWSSFFFSSLLFSSLLFSSLTLPTSAFSCVHYTSSTAQGGGGSFKNRKPIGEIGCCESGMAERSHWWTERCLISLTLSLSFSGYLPTYPSIFYVSIYLLI